MTIGWRWTIFLESSDSFSPFVIQMVHVFPSSIKVLKAWWLDKQHFNGRNFIQGIVEFTLKWNYLKLMPLIALHFYWPLRDLLWCLGIKKTFVEKIWFILQPKTPPTDDCTWKEMERCFIDKSQHDSCELKSLLKCHSQHLRNICLALLSNLSWNFIKQMTWNSGFLMVV